MAQICVHAAEGIHDVPGDDAYYERSSLAIKQGWPGGDKGKSFILQEDNCRVHKKSFQETISTAAKGVGLNVECKPPQSANSSSPDFKNVLDLGCFHSIQSIKDCTNSKNVDELITNVNNAYLAKERETIDNV